MRQHVNNPATLHLSQGRDSINEPEAKTDSVQMATTSHTSCLEKDRFGVDVYLAFLGLGLLAIGSLLIPVHVYRRLVALIAE